MRQEVTSGVRTGRRRAGALVTAAALALAIAACGSDDDTADEAAEAAATTTTESSVTSDSEPAEAGGANEAYCELAREMDEQEAFPDAEQIEALIDEAPDEIREDVEFIGARFLEALEEGEEAVFELFSDPEFGQRLEPIEAFEIEECGLEPGTSEPEGMSNEIDEDAQRVDVVATEYEFEFTAPESGAASFVMDNQGDEPHLISIGKLNEGLTMADAMESDDPEAMLEWEATSPVAGPGEEAVLTLQDLTPGTYAVICYLPAPDGEPHLAKGMATEFTIE